MARIGVMDSGVGGISVLRELVRQLPNEDFVFFGDSAHAPYGTKSVSEVRRLAFDAAAALQKYDIKALVVACNTATGACIDDLRKAFDFPIIGIEPAIKPAVCAHPNGRILILATPTTLQNEKYKRLLEKYQDSAELIAVPCDGLMEFVERGELDSEALRQYLHQRLDDLLPADAMVLGCTHYPFVRPVLAEITGIHEIFDGAPGTARETARKLAECDLLGSDGKSDILFLNSKNEEMAALSEKLFTLPGETNDAQA